MTKYALYSDTQFDQQLSYATILPTGISSRLQDSIDCFDWIVSEAVKRKCKRLIHLGDVFDWRTEIDVSVLHEVGRAYQRARATGIENDMLPGNHDSYLRTSRINSLQVMAGLVNIYDRPTVVPPFAFVPWVEDDEAFAKSVEVVAKDDRAKVLLTHCIVVGAVPAGVGRPLELLQPKRWKRIILGDVHDPVSVKPNVQYCGSPMQWHYGDAGGRRGFFVLDDRDWSLEFVENVISPRFHNVVNKADVGQARDGDFARIKAVDATLAKVLAKSLTGRKLRRLEQTLVDIPDVDVRLDIKVSDDHEDVLRRWVEHQEVDDDGLVELGLDLLREARA